MRPLERTLLKASAYVFVLFVVAAIFMPVFACGCKPVSPASACLSNVKYQTVGFLQYAADHDERLPDRDVWMDGYAKLIEVGR